MPYRRLRPCNAPSFLDVDPALLQVVLSLIDCDVRTGEFETLAALARVCRQWRDEVHHAAAAHIERLAAKPYDTIPSLAPYVAAMIGAMRLCRRHEDVANLARDFTTISVDSFDGIYTLETALSDHAIAVAFRDIDVPWDSVPLVMRSGISFPMSDDVHALMELLFGGLRSDPRNITDVRRVGNFEHMPSSHTKYIIEHAIECWRLRVGLVFAHGASETRRAQQRADFRAGLSDIIETRMWPMEMRDMRRGLVKYMQARDNPVAKMFWRTDIFEGALLHVSAEDANEIRRYYDTMWETRALEFYTPQEVMRMRRKALRRTLGRTEAARIRKLAESIKPMWTDEDHCGDVPTHKLALTDSEAED